MESWLTHLLSWIGGGGVVALFGFLLRWRKQSAENQKQATGDRRDDWQVLFDQMHTERAQIVARVGTLEGQVEKVQREHMDCVREQGELRGQLQAQRDMAMAMHQENKQSLRVMSETLLSLDKRIK